MKQITITIKNAAGETLAGETAENTVNLVYAASYTDGDTITLEAPEHSFLNVQLDDVLEPALVYMGRNRYVYTIPFGEKRFSYNPKAFSGDIHLLKARFATDAERHLYRNLASNSHDTAGNDCCFPHASANIETRGESVFAARNAIDGNTENRHHGNWPYESWGINQDPAAELAVDFGRPVTIDKLVLVTRADFPHDNYWKQADVRFSDGTCMQLSMEKSVKPHEWLFPPKTVSGLKLGNLLKDETDPSPFPALIQLEAYGTETE